MAVLEELAPAALDLFFTSLKRENLSNSSATFTSLTLIVADNLIFACAVANLMSVSKVLAVIGVVREFLVFSSFLKDA